MALPQLISILLPYGHFREKICERKGGLEKRSQHVDGNRKRAFSGKEENEEKVQKETEKKESDNDLC